MERRFELVIFDLDGTLIDNRVAIRENINRALREHGLPEVDISAIDKTIGVPLEDAFIILSPGITPETALELRARYRSSYEPNSHKGVEFLEGVPEVLVSLKKKGFKLAIATTKTAFILKPLLEKIDLMKYFDLPMGRVDGMKSKPDPQMINYILNKLEVKPQRAVMVGDTEIDVLAGKNA